MNDNESASGTSIKDLSELGCGCFVSIFLCGAVAYAVGYVYKESFFGEMTEEQALAIFGLLMIGSLYLLLKTNRSGANGSENNGTAG